MAGNRVLMGVNGPVIVAIDHEFGWLKFLKAPDWQNYFNESQERRFGYRAEGPITSQGVQTASAPYTLKTTAGTVYIGYSPSSGAPLRASAREGSRYSLRPRLEGELARFQSGRRPSGDCAIHFGPQRQTNTTF